MTIGVIGTTIAPWMQFYLQSSIVDKGITIKGLQGVAARRHRRLHLTDIVAWFIIVACAATLYVHGIPRYRRRLGRGPGHEAAGRTICFHSLCRRAVQRLALCRVYPASLDGIHRMRGPRLRERPRQELQGSALLLLVLHPADRLWRGRGAHPELPHVQIAVLSQVLNGVLLR